MAWARSRTTGETLHGPVGRTVCHRCETSQTVPRRYETVRNVSTMCQPAGRNAGPGGGMHDAPRPRPGGVDCLADGPSARLPNASRRATALGYFAAAGFEKSTVGAVRAPGFVTSKYSRGFAPVTFAVRDCGSVRMYVLYCWTAVL